VKNILNKQIVNFLQTAHSQGIPKESS